MHNIKIVNDLNNIFKFLEDKKGKRAPLIWKIFNDPDSITKDDLNFKGDLSLYNTKISSLPDNLTVGGYLDLHNTKISSLPDNLTVEGWLDLGNSKISSLPDNLKVGGWLDLRNTPLSGKFSKDKIRKMIEDKGGSVGRHII